VKITLAYPFGDHQPDETIEIDAETGNQLIRDGLARLPDPAKPKAKPAE
jgi:hypothetical protein